MMTSNVLNGTGAINYVANSLTALGNNGSSKSATISSETTSSDHLPVIADYTFTVATPEPGTAMVVGLGMLGLIGRRRR